MGNAVFDPNVYRRIARVEISPELLAQAVVEGKLINLLCQEGVPVEAKCIGAAVDPQTMNINLYFTHYTFMPVIQGMVIPVIPVVMKNLSE